MDNGYRWGNLSYGQDYAVSYFIVRVFSLLVSCSFVTNYFLLALPLAGRQASFMAAANKVIVIRDNMENLNAIKYGKVTGDKLSKISLALGRSKRLVFAQMVDYFYRNKKDPTDLNDELLKISMAKGHKSYMAFIRSQEDLLLIPIKQGVEKMITNQRDIVKFFNEQVLGANKALLKNQEELLKTARANDQEIKTLKQTAESRESLKLKMLQLFNGYLKSYQELGSFKGKEKVELAEQMRTQIKNL